MIALAHLTIGIAALTALLGAAWCDLRHRTIPNRASAVLLALALPHHALRADDWSAALAGGGGALLLAGVVFAVGYGLWRLGGLGGGDVKLLTAAAFLVGVDGAPALFLGTALGGGVLALACLLTPLQPLLPAGRAASEVGGVAGGRPTVPYGVAIALGAAVALVPTLPVLLA